MVVSKNSQKKIPQLKFLKSQVPFVINGHKTLEPRPRSSLWISKMCASDVIDLTFGPRYAPPTIFATAKVIKLEIRPFETTKLTDLVMISRGWENKSIQEFIDAHNTWYEKDIRKGYQVAWIYFKITNRYLSEGFYSR